MTDPDPRGSDRDACDHEWHPVTLTLGVQLLDDHGRYVIGPIPDPDESRVYMVCLLCASHTYMTTKWVGCRLYGSEDQHPDGTWMEDEDTETEETTP